MSETAPRLPAIVLAGGKTRPEFAAEAGVERRALAAIHGRTMVSYVLRALRQAIDLGYSDFDWMQQDPDLDALKDRPEFIAMLDQLKPQS